MVLKEGKVPGILISEMTWENIKQSGTMNPQGPFPCLSDFRWCNFRYAVRNGSSPTPVIPLPLDLVAINKALADFPEEANLVPFTSSLLRIDSKA